jgi:hypothetical protein
MAPAWLSHLVDRLRARGDGATERERRVLAVLAQRAAFSDEPGFLAALRAALEPDAGRPGSPAKPDSIEEHIVEILALNLHGHDGEELDRVGAHVGEHLALWSSVVDRSASHLARACRADVLLRAGDRAGALGDFLDAIDGDAGLVAFQPDLAELAREAGGEPRLRFRLAELRAALVGLASDDDDDDDSVREMYGELLEEFRAEPGAIARIREVGALIDAAVDRGELPRAIVRRGPRS